MICWWHRADHGQCRITDLYTVWRFRRIIRKHGPKRAAEIIREKLYGR